MGNEVLIESLSWIFHEPPKVSAAITLVINTLWSLRNLFTVIFLFTIKCGLPKILILSFVTIFFIPILFKSFDPHNSLGLSFWFNSDNFLKYETPLALAAIKKIKRNSSIAALFKLVGQFIGFIFYMMKLLNQQFFHLYRFWYF